MTIFTKTFPVVFFLRSSAFYTFKMLLRPSIIPMQCNMLLTSNFLKIIFSVILSAVIVFLLVGISVFFVFVATEATVVTISSYSKKTLGCVTGDVMGATNEINRMVAILVVLAAMG